MNFQRAAAAMRCACLCAAIAASPASAAVIFTNDAAAWSTVHVDQQTFLLTAQDVLKADEVTVLPTNLTPLSQTLTFPGAATGLGRDFQLNALSGWPFSFRSNLTGPFGAQGLTSADLNAQNGTDWDVRFSGGGSAIRGFGFNLIDNEIDPDRVLVYDTAGVLMGALQNITEKDTFIGVTSSVPIGRVMLDGDSIDYSVFNGLRLSFIPEPATAGPAMFILFATRRGRRPATATTSRRRGRRSWCRSTR